MYKTLAAEERSVRRYFGDIAASKPLSREREVTLAARIKEGDMEARDELVGANLRFVVDVAKSYQHRGLSLLELISAGNLGLLTATDRFDGARGFNGFHNLFNDGLFLSVRHAAGVQEFSNLFYLFAFFRH